ncbi:MAG: DUF5916 domain-containing protein [Candidatus Acidiferrales bacterium]
MIPRVERAPTLEDFLGMEPNGEWTGKLAKLEGYIQTVPRDGEPASQRTDTYLGYDQENFYLVFVCFDNEPKKVRARMVRREDVFGDDIVLVHLDTFFDRRRSYVFITNPFGIQLDGLWTEGSGFNFSFDTIWKSRGQLTPQGFVVWMAIPFKSLRFPASGQQTWGILLARDIIRNDESSFWPHLSSKVEGRLNQQATLRGLENISPGRNMQLIPYGSFRSFRAVDARDPAAPRFSEKAAELDGGLDAKFVFKDSLVLDVTVNPDFAQVESDEPQVTVNQRFEVFFPEKRPFFLENSTYFETPTRLLFTRRIADPQFGVRLTGKLGPYQLGALLMDDQSPGRSVPPGDPLHDKRALFGIVRGSFDLGRQSTLGFIYTDREFEDTYNRLGGLDGRLKLSPNWIARFQGLTSWTRNDDGTEQAGPAYLARLARIGRHLILQSEYNDRSPGFVTAAGFVPRTDIRHFRQEVEYNFRPEGKYLISWGPESNTEIVYDHSGTRLDLTQDTGLDIQFAGNTFVFLGYHCDRERLRPVDFDVLTQNRDFQRNRKVIGVHSSYFRSVGVFAEYQWGTRINFVPALGQELELADLTAGELQLTWRPLTRLRIENSFLHNRLTHRGAGENTFNNHIVRSKWNWQFTRELSLRVILQYNAVLANPAHTALETTKNINADFLVTYLINPWTALYVGYNGNAQNLDPNLAVCQGPGSSRPGCPALADGDFSVLRARDRYINDAKQFFVKFSYLIRF